MSTMETVRGPEIHVRPTAPTYTSATTIRGKMSDAGLADELELNTRYFSSVPGILKLVQIVIAIVAFCCISPPLAVILSISILLLSKPYRLMTIKSKVVCPSVHLHPIDIVCPHPVVVFRLPGDPAACSLASIRLAPSRIGLHLASECVSVPKFHLADCLHIPRRLSLSSKLGEFHPWHELLWSLHCCWGKFFEDSIWRSSSDCFKSI